MGAYSGCQSNIGRSHGAYLCRHGDWHILLRPYISANGKWDSLTDLDILERDPSVSANLELMLFSAFNDKATSRSQPNRRCVAAHVPVGDAVKRSCAIVHRDGCPCRQHSVQGIIAHEATFSKH